MEVGGELRGCLGCGGIYRVNLLGCTHLFISGLPGNRKINVLFLYNKIINNTQSAHFFKEQ